MTAMRPGTTPPKKADGAPATSQAKKKTSPGVIVAIAAVVVAAALATAWALRAPSDALDADTVLSKEEWTAPELESALSRVFRFDVDRARRIDMTVHLQRKIQGLPADEARRVRATALKDAMNHNLREYRAMNPEQRQRLISRLDSEAAPLIREALGAEGANRKELRSLFGSEEAKEVVGEAVRVVFEDMSAEERSELMPLVQKWLDTMQKMQK